MTTLNQENTLGDVLLFEADGHFSREEVTLTGGDYEIGTVLGQITADKKFTANDPAAVDGSEVAVAVLATSAKAAAGDVSGIIIDTHARVKRAGLKWGAGITTEPQRSTAVTQLRTVGIKTDA